MFVVFARIARLALLSAAFALSAGAVAHEFHAGGIHIEHPWARATPPGAPNGAGYLVIENRGGQPEQLISATSPVAAKVELHQSRESDGMARMVKTGLPYTLAPGESLKLAPGGHHLMLMGLTAPLVAGEPVPLTLEFEHAGTVEVELSVRGLDHQGPKQAPAHSGHANH